MYNSNRGLTGLDFETYGGVDLLTHGLARYVEHDSFTPLIAGIAKWDNVNGFAGRQRHFMYGPHREAGVQAIREALADSYLVAHNAPFELAVLKHLGIEVDLEYVIDSAVVARGAGASGTLAKAAPQLLGVGKIEEGPELIRLFSIPGPYQEANGNLDFDPRIIEDNPQQWSYFGEYCEQDAYLGVRLVRENLLNGPVQWQEIEFAALTMKMNERGWPVDVPLVEEMQRRYLENLSQSEEKFREVTGAHDLNLNSGPQMQAWCRERGIKATSFNEKNVASLLKKIQKRMLNDGHVLSGEQVKNYADVAWLLTTKQVLGGSSLKKLKVILNTVTKDGRLHDQYMHLGAGQTYRTTGRSVQMQNLKRLNGGGSDMDELWDQESDWDNEQLGENLRQVFTASEKKGALIVGDLSSIESRGLAWQARAMWKTTAYSKGQDLYKVLAGSIFNVPYEQVTKAQRTTGKVGELSCGYGAGGGAVQSFAEGMGVEMNAAEANQLVKDWRASNPEIVEYWAALDDMLQRLLHAGNSQQLMVQLNEGWLLEGSLRAAPLSLRQQSANGTQSLHLQVFDANGNLFMHRVFHGVHTKGRDICYYKPSELKSGNLWKDTFVDPNTKQTRRYTIYGGKLAGILTQSFCRELFFRILKDVEDSFSKVSNVEVIGQFHDEIVLDWKPRPEKTFSTWGTSLSLKTAEARLKSIMTRTFGLANFPMDAEINSAYRYIK